MSYLVFWVEAEVTDNQKPSLLPQEAIEAPPMEELQKLMELFSRDSEENQKGSVQYCMSQEMNLIGNDQKFSTLAVMTQ